MRLGYNLSPSSREESDEFKLKLSDVYFALGEVALESGIILSLTFNTKRKML